MSLKQQRKLNKSKKGYTLVEMLVSIAIFGIVSVIMTGIVINIGTLSLTTDHRNDFIAELDSATTILKNEMRNAEKLGTCTTASPSTIGPLYLIKKADSVGIKKIYQLKIISELSTNKLVLNELAGVDASGKCTDMTGSVPELIKLTSNNMLIQNLTITKSVQSSDPQNKSQLAYIAFEACDADAVSRKLFLCDANAVNGNPYKFVLAITTRNF